METQDQMIKSPEADRLSVVWELLDEETAWKKFSMIDHKNYNLVTSFFEIQGMDCAACTFKIEDGLKKIKGVQKVIVNSITERAEVTWDKTKTVPSTLIKNISQLGYEAIPFQKIDQRIKRDQETRQLFWRMLLALLCMMQVMMYTYPIYITQVGEISSDYLQLLRWAAWLISVPVAIFATKPFFQAAWRAVKMRTFTMDVTVLLGMILTFAVSTQASLVNNNKDIYFDSFVMLVLILLMGRYIERKLKNRSLDFVEKLLNAIPQTVVKMRKEGKKERVLVSTLEINDHILVQAGETIPADGKIIQGSTYTDESILTGESTPIQKAVGDTVYGGTVNTQNSIEITITTNEIESRIGQIIQLMNQSAEAKPNIIRLIDRIAIHFSFSIFMIAILAAAYWWSEGAEFAVMVAVSVLVITCPCAVVLATPAAMIASTGFLAKNGILVKNANAFESIKEVDAVIFDKTGTLTIDQLTVYRMDFVENIYVDDQQLLKIIEQLTVTSMHPLSKAMNKYARQIVGDSYIAVKTVTERAGQGLQAEVQIDQLVFDVKIGSHQFINRSDMQPDARVYITINDVLVAKMNFQEELRENIRDLLTYLQGKGIETYILSGDSKDKVHSLAEKLGVKFAVGECTPEHKTKFVKDLQQQGKKVVMIGDGINDAPVLSVADVSIAFGMEAPISHQYADFIFASKDLGKLKVLIHKAQNTLSIIKQNIFWSFIYNLICIPIAFIGLVPAWLAGLGMALSSLLVVANASRLTLGK